MKARGDSGNDVFLSALDLFMLLLFAFIGVHLHGAEVRSESKWGVPLPLMGQRVHGASVISEREVIWLQWESAADRSRGRTERCRVTIREGKTKQTDAVPCWPASFGGVSGLGAHFATLGTTHRKAVVACPRGEADVAACARLAWLAIESGIDATVGFDQDKGAP